LVALQLFPVVLSLLVLGAHFLRAGNRVLLAAVLVVLILLAVRRPWAARAVQATLAIGALEWCRTLVGLASERLAAGEPARRLVIILGSVAMLTALSSLLFATARLRRVYGLGGRASSTTSA
jgi:hypothetical protein